MSGGRVFLAMPGNENMALALARHAGGRAENVEARRFPDQESYVRLNGEVRGKRVDLVCTLANPDPQFLRLIFAAETARDLGAASVHLVAPYLAYMRQDKRFKPREALSSAVFGRLLSQHFDSLTTVDPHLHRRRALSEVFSIPARTAHAAPLLAQWIKAHVAAPLIVGPDAESEQWASEIAACAQAPYVVLEKERSGDREVVVHAPDLGGWSERTPVLVDDIISSGETMRTAAAELVGRGLAKPYCVVVHALFAEGAYEALCGDAAAVVSTDTVPHASNAVAVAQLLV